MPESTPDQPGGQTTQHQPGDPHGDSVSQQQPAVSHEASVASHQPGDQQVGAMPAEAAAEPGQTERKFVQPSEAIRAEVRERPDHVPTAPPAQAQPLEAPVPEVFKQQPPPEPEPAPTASISATTPAVTAPSRPSGRWQAFWFAISALTLWMAVSVTSLATRQGTLRKLLVSVVDNGNTMLIGTKLDILIAQLGFSVMIVCIPLFIISTVFVDRYKSVHPDLNTAGMKAIAYFFMILAVFSIVITLVAEVYTLLNLMSASINWIVGPIVEIVFTMAYIYWLYMTVSEDRRK